MNYIESIQWFQFLIESNLPFGRLVRLIYSSYFGPQAKLIQQ